MQFYYHIIICALYILSHLFRYFRLWQCHVYPCANNLMYILCFIDWSPRVFLVMTLSLLHAPKFVVMAALCVTSCDWPDTMTAIALQYPWMHVRFAHVLNYFETTSGFPQLLLEKNMFQFCFKIDTVILYCDMVLFKYTFAKMQNGRLYSEDYTNRRKSSYIMIHWSAVYFYFYLEYFHCVIQYDKVHFIGFDKHVANIV